MECFVVLVMVLHMVTDCRFQAYPDLERVRRRKECTDNGADSGAESPQNHPPGAQARAVTVHDGH